MDNFVIKTKKRKRGRLFSICKIYKSHLAKVAIWQRELPLKNEK